MSADTTQQDWSPRAAYEPRGQSWDEVLGGLIAVVCVAGVLPLTMLTTSLVADAVLEALGVEPVVVEPDEELPPVEVVVARFVRLGTAPEPRRMPSRYIPTASTAPQPIPSTAPGDGITPLETTATPENALAPDQAGTRPRNEANTATASAQAADARAALLERLGDRAEATAELATPRFREGDPDGIAEGTETRDRADVYPGRLYTFFRRGWQVPSSIAASELRGLSCSVSVDITSDGRVGAYRITRSSGDEAFDASVRQRMAQAVGATLPAPPPEEAERYLGHSVPFRFVPPR